MPVIVFTLLIIIVAVLLIGVVLIQNSKGGGLASNVGLSTQMMGVKKTADAVEKWTWYLVAAMVLLCIASGVAFGSHKKKGPGDIEIISPTPGVTNNAPNPNLGNTNGGQPNGGGTTQPVQ